MFYGANVWDPRLIIAQIVALQCLFYLSLGAWTALFVGAFAPRLGLSVLLDAKALNMHSGLGWLALLANLANAPAMALCLLWIVQRAKKCLDFAATLYLLHLSACCAYGGFPRSLGWWGANVAGFVVTALAGEWLCLRREMQDIPTGFFRSRKASVPGGSGGVELTAPGAASSSSSAIANGKPGHKRTPSSVALLERGRGDENV